MRTGPVAGRLESRRPRMEGPWYQGLVLSAALVAAAVTGCAGTASGPAPGGDATVGPPPSKASEEQYKVFPDDGIPQYGGVLQLARLNDTKSLNFLVPTSTYTMIAVNGVYETLVNLDWRGDHLTYTAAIAPGVAKSWEMSADGTVWTFKIHDNARWHDGLPVTSADVKATYDHYLSYAEAAPPARSYTAPFITAIETPDPKTVVLRLNGPTPVLLNNLAVHWTMIVPKKSLDQGMDYLTNNAIGSGPFKFVHNKWERGISYEWERNPDYWDPDVPFLDGKKIFIIGDRSAQIAAFETRKIDDTWEASLNQAAALERKYGQRVEVLRINGGSFPHIQMNTQRPPFDNPTFRKALYFWWDRQEFLEKAGEGAGELGEWINPKIFEDQEGKGYGTPFEELAKNNLAFSADRNAARQRARQLLSEARVNPANHRPKIVVENTDDLVRGGQVMANQLRQMGFEPELQTMEQVAAQKAHLDGEYDILFRSGVIPFPTPDGMLSRYLGPGGTRNYSRVQDATYLRMLDELNRTVDPKRRAGILAEFDGYFQEGSYPTHIAYWAHYVIARWDYNKGRKYFQVAGHQPDDRAWLGPDAPGRK